MDVFGILDLIFGFKWSWFSECIIWLSSAFHVCFAPHNDFLWFLFFHVHWISIVIFLFDMSDEVIVPYCPNNLISTAGLWLLQWKQFTCVSENPIHSSATVQHQDTQWFPASTRRWVVTPCVKHQLGRPISFLHTQVAACVLRQPQLHSSAYPPR